MRNIECMIHRIHLGVASTRRDALVISCRDLVLHRGHCWLRQTLEDVYMFQARGGYARRKSRKWFPPLKDFILQTITDADLLVFDLISTAQRWLWEWSQPSYNSLDWTHALKIASQWRDDIVTSLISHHRLLLFCSSALFLGVEQ